ncbi:MAG: AmmeMemoRadiSam system radical SAM enzyme [Patescibacteria group bacterium]
MKECLLYKKLDREIVQCQTCAHQCVILPRHRGICGVRENQSGRLYLLVYGKAISENVDPIEKKPLFHFLPGTQSLSIATAGCNFRCANCQNADISQASKEGLEATNRSFQRTATLMKFGKAAQENFFENKTIPGQDLPPEKVVHDAKNSGCPSISYTYTEPTIFLEYALDCMKLAKKNGLKNVWVSNGYQTPQTIKLIAPYLDAINIDLKSYRDDSYLKNCGAHLQPVLDSLILMKKSRIWVEVTTLIIPEFNDSEKELQDIANFIFKKLGKETPWHISKFYPAYRLPGTPETPIETIHKACKIGKSADLKYVYAGNIPGDEYENTYCPKCHKLCIERLGYEMQRFDKQGKCPKCETDLNIIE